MMLSLRPNQGLVKRPRLPFPSCSSWRLSRKTLRLWSWHQPESSLSRYAVPELTITLSVSQTKAAYSGSSQIQGTLLLFFLPYQSINVDFCVLNLHNLMICSAGSNHPCSSSGRLIYHHYLMSCSIYCKCLEIILIHGSVVRLPGTLHGIIVTSFGLKYEMMVSLSFGADLSWRWAFQLIILVQCFALVVHSECETWYLCILGISFI